MEACHQGTTDIASTPSASAVIKSNGVPHQLDFVDALFTLGLATRLAHHDNQSFHGQLLT
jgi:hypothetical protein